MYFFSFEDQKMRELQDSLALVSRNHIIYKEQSSIDEPLLNYLGIPENKLYLQWKGDMPADIPEDISKSVDD